MGIELAIHEEHIITLVLCTLNERVLGLHIGSIKVNHLLVLVGLLCLDSLPVLIETEILAVSILQKSKFHSPLAELLV